MFLQSDFHIFEFHPEKIEIYYFVHLDFLWLITLIAWLLIYHVTDILTTLTINHCVYSDYMTYNLMTRVLLWDYAAKSNAWNIAMLTWLYNHAITWHIDVHSPILESILIHLNKWTVLQMQLLWQPLQPFKMPHTLSYDAKQTLASVWSAQLA